MTPIIEVIHLQKYFKVGKHRRGFWGALRGLASWQTTLVKAVDGISFRIEPGEIESVLRPVSVVARDRSNSALATIRSRAVFPNYNRTGLPNSNDVGAFTGKLGKQVATPIFTMVDDGTLSNARGTINFDDEGTAAQRNVLIKDGVLVKYMTDVLSAKQLKMPRTGNGRRESFRYLPIPRMTNTFIDNGKDKPEDIVASTRNGIYVQSLI